MYSSFLKPYNARRSHSDVSVGSHSSTESEHSSSSPRFPRQNSGSTLTVNPSSMAVSFTSGSCQKQPQDALKELDQETLSASLNLGCSDSSLSRCPSDPDPSSLPRTWDSAEAARDINQSAPALRSHRNPRHPEMVGYSLPGRNGQGKDLIKGCTRTTPSPEDKNEEPESSEAEGNQVSAPRSPCEEGEAWERGVPGTPEAGIWAELSSRATLRKSAVYPVYLGFYSNSYFFLPIEFRNNILAQVHFFPFFFVMAYSCLMYLNIAFVS